MSWNPALAPDCPNQRNLDSIETLIIPRARDIGELYVRRALPSARRQMVGPFTFFDQMGPAEFITEGGIDVRPHPHIGLGTVTYLDRGEFQHRDNLGTKQMIHMAPDFEHHGKDALPFLDAHGAHARLILGNAWGERAPVTMQSEIFYADVVLKPGALSLMPDDHEDRCHYTTDASIEIAGESFEVAQS